MQVDKNSKRKTNKISKSETRQKSNISKNIENNNYYSEYTKKNYQLYLLFAVICILPLIVRMLYYQPKLSGFPWFNNEEYEFDFFLYYKHKFFLLLAAFMLIVIIYKVIFKRNEIKLSKIFIPLALYAILAILSTIFSEYSSYSLTGSYSQFESVFALLGYCITAYYAFLILSTEKDFQYLYYFLIALSLVMSLLGVFQFMGMDFLNSELGKNIILPPELRNVNYTNSMGPNRVYLTLYNPNYVGVLASLLIPILFVMTLMYRKVLCTILSIISIIGLSICVVGAQSLAGVIGIGVALICMVVFLWRYIIKHFVIALVITVLVIIGVYAIDKMTNHYLYNKMSAATKITKTEHALSSIESKDDRVSITYNNEVMNLIFILNDDNSAQITAYDNNYGHIENVFDPNTGVYTITDKRFEGIQFGFDEEVDGVFYALIEGKKWRFTNLTEDQTYYFVNRFNKLDKIVNPPAAFRGYEMLASGRGYVWSRTLPLLKKHLLLGLGPDTYIFAFPQNDYLGLYQNGMETNVVTKPHNLYLQIGLQTGVVSLIAFILFYMAYFISSARLYIRGRFKSFYSRFGLAVFIGTIGYMVSGISNDSSITIAPIFWALMGTGIAVNYKAKPLILKEIAELKEQKANKKAIEANSLQKVD